MSKFLNKKEAAELLGVSVRSIDYYREKSKLPCHIIPGGTSVRFVESEIREWMGVAPEPEVTVGGSQVTTAPDVTNAELHKF